MMGGMGGMMGGLGGFGGWGGMPFGGFGLFGLGGLLNMLIWFAIIGGAIWLIARAVNNGTMGQREPSALEILKARYARGELSREEFERIQQDLLRFG